MTINVVIKSPMGVIMGADSLVTIRGGVEGGIGATIPFYPKVFSLEPFAAGVTLSGYGSIGGRTIEDIIEEFSEYYPTVHNPNNYSLKEMVVNLGHKINKIIYEYGKGTELELIVAGYSKGIEAAGKRYGEVYSLRWQNSKNKVRYKNNYSLVELVSKDSQFGTFYGGQQFALDRFLYGFDDFMIERILERREMLFKQVREYIYQNIKKAGGKIPKNLSIPSPNLQQFNVFRLFSDYKIEGEGSQIVRKIKIGSIGKLFTIEGFFSLQTAINYCIFLMSCAYAVNSFTYGLPTVGSEMKIATITRKEGFKFKKAGDISYFLRNQA
jgi:hypothetical protein